MSGSWASYGLMLLMGACSQSGSEPAESAASHVHGLGVNPADGSLFVATHSGLFRIEGGEARRQGTLTQDTMGFVIAGPDRFLGSGHPDPGADTILQPGMRPLLGLIESTDQGRSWRGLSLQGEVDFHALAFTPDGVYGFDGSTRRFMVSVDLKQWETRSQADLLAFAVSPSDAKRITGVSSDRGVVLSKDGGRSWTRIGNVAPLAFVSWNGTRGLWAIGASGDVFRGADDGSSWTKTGTLAGSPAALLAHETGLYVATADAIYRSDDGASFTAVAKVH